VNHGRVTIFAGGISLKRGVEVVGGICVSGGGAAQNEPDSEVGAAVF
jgi:uncharacterized protein GlcG (DUF336 family)